MSYSMIGAVDLASCSPTGPANAFKLVNGVAKPTNCTALAAFIEFQMELSRLGPLRADGDIGPATVSLYNKFATTKSTAAQIATNVKALTLATSIRANYENKPPPKPVPPPKPSVQKDGTLKNENPPPYTAETFTDTALGFVTSPMGIVAAAGAIGLLIFLKKRRSAPRAAAPALVSNPSVWVVSGGSSGFRSFKSKKTADRFARHTGGVVVKESGSSLADFVSMMSKHPRAR